MNYNRAFFFNITYKCNNNCKECISRHTREHSNRTVGLNEIIDFNSKFNFSYSDRIVISGGEPTLHCEFNKIIEYLNIYSSHIIVFTNGRSLDTIPNNIIDKIERLIIPFYGDELKHNEYTRNRNSYTETIKSINMLHAFSNKIELKLIIQDLSTLLYYLNNKEFNRLIKLTSKTISIAGFINSTSKKSSIKYEIFKPLEEFINKLITMGKNVKIYDIPLCKFSTNMIESINKKFNSKLSITFSQKFCCSSKGEYKEVFYNSIPNYSPNCTKCKLNTICTMVLKRYNVLCLSNQNSYLDTE